MTRHDHRPALKNMGLSRSYDIATRNERAFQTISKYIIHNPQNWKEYRFSGIE